MGFWRRWWVGVRELSELDQLRSKRAAIVGQSVGCVLAMGWLALTGGWVWLVLLFFTLVIFFVVRVRVFLCILGVLC